MAHHPAPEPTVRLVTGHGTTELNWRLPPRDVVPNVSVRIIAERIVTAPGTLGTFNDGPAVLLRTGGKQPIVRVVRRIENAKPTVAILVLAERIHTHLNPRKLGRSSSVIVETLQTNLASKLLDSLTGEANWTRDGRATEPEVAQSFEIEDQSSGSEDGTWTLLDSFGMLLTTLVYSVDSRLNQSWGGALVTECKRRRWIVEVLAAILAILYYL